MNKLLTVYLLCFVVFSASGCFPLLVGAAAGAGGITYLRGASEKNFDRSVEKVYSASIKALNKQQMVITKDSVSKHDAIIQFSTNDGRAGKINIKAVTEKSSKISVRIGTFGDETLSRIILTSVEANL